MCIQKLAVNPVFGFSFALFLLLLLLLQNVTALEIMSASCFKKHFSAASPFEFNLNDVINSLSNSDPELDIWQATIGQGLDLAFGLALCRGDVNAADCKICLQSAGAEIRKRCTFRKGGIIWYDTCMLKYSSTPFYGMIDLRHKFYKCNPNNVRSRKEMIGAKLKLFHWLTKQAHKNPKLYAAGNVQVGKSSQLYGFVQCTRDLSSYKCRKCLINARRKLTMSYCHNKKSGAAIFTGSCMVRYDSNPFLTA